MLLEKRLEEFCKLYNLLNPKQIDKGHSSFIFLAQSKTLRKKIIIKIERDTSTRKNMFERESSYLKLANSKKIGPKLFFSSKKHRALAMQYIKGVPFSEYVFSSPKKDLEKTISLLLKQAKILDSINLDHGQLAGRGKNILVEKTKPYIIDFEKASSNRKPHNYTVLQSFLFNSKNSEITKQVLKKIKINSSINK